jgi:membrane protease YdiL (CAAX protease family)
MKKVTKTNVIFTALILIYIIMTFSIRLIPKRFLTYNLLLVLPEIVILLAALGVAKLLKVDTLKEPKFTAVSIGTCVKSVILAFLCLPLIGAISAITSNISGNTASNAISKVMDNPLWLNLLLLAVLPALVEEYVFRGLIFLGYKKRNPLKAVLLSAVLFGFMHLNINQFSYAFVLGIVLALLVYATGSIIPGILVHFTINGYSVVVSYILANKVTDSTEPVNEAATGQITVFTILFLIAVLIMLTSFAVRLFLNICKHNRGINSVKNIFNKDMWNTYADEGKFIDGYLMTGVIICIVFIVYFDFIV